jgi:hypothetical protein
MAYNHKSQAAEDGFDVILAAAWMLSVIWVHSSLAFVCLIICVS